jgi:hypothetical protein
LPLDMHTLRSQKKGHDDRLFVEDASRAMPEVNDKDQRYRDWIIKPLDEGRLP